MPFARGEESDSGGGVAEILVTVNDGLLSSGFLSLRPLVGELDSPSLSCGRVAAGQSGCLSVTVRCVHQLWSPLSLSTGGGTLGITVVPVPAVR